MKFYRIYQLPSNSKRLFRRYDEAHKVDIHDYCCVWADEVEAELKDDVDRSSFCEDLFMKFNCEHPKGFGGHSMSVSDIVMIHDDEGEGRTDYYYCDSIGFKEIDVEKTALQASLNAI